MKLRVRPEEVLIGAITGTLVGYSSGLPLLLLAGAQQDGWGFFILRADAAPPLARLAHAALWSLGFAGALAGAWLATRQESEQHVSGIRYIADLMRAARALRKIERPRMSHAQRAGKRPGLTIGGVELSRSRETEHTLVRGLSGAGKTASVMLPAVDQALARAGSRVLLHDPKGDFTSIYYDPATTVLLGPWDARSAIWDAAADIDSAALAEEFSASICGVADSGQNKHFHVGAANVLGGLIKARLVAGNGWTWSQIAADLAADPVALIQKAATGDPLVTGSFPSVFAPSRGSIELTKAERDTISTLSNASRLIMQLAAVDAGKPDSPRFSLRKWIAGTAHADIRIAILNNSPLYAQAARDIFGAMLSAVTATVASALPPEKSSDDDDGMWVVIDEGKQLGAGGLQAIQTIEEVGRCRGVRVILALQDAAQLAALVGKDQAEPMLNMQSTRVYLRSSPASATQIIESLGKREIRRLQGTVDGGAVQGKTSGTDTGLAVMATSEIAGLSVTRLRDQTVDIEMLVNIESIVGRVIANSGPRRAARAEHAAPCPVWSRGTLPKAPAAAPAPAQTPALTPTQPAELAPGDPDVLDDIWSDRPARDDPEPEQEQE